MAAIPTILKGDDSGAITITLATGRSYVGATLVVAYQGVTRTYTNLNPGQSISLVYTHDETARFSLGTKPMLMRLIGQYGAEETVENADARIKVTNCLAEVNSGGSFIVTPGQAGTDPTKVPITDVGDMAARYTIADLQAKVNQIVHVLAQRSLLALAVVCGTFAAFGDVTKARLDTLYNDSMVVTDVTGVGVATNEVNSLILQYDATNITARINAKQNVIDDYTTTNAVKGIVQGYSFATTAQLNEVKNNYVKGANVENDTLSLTKIENGVESTITFAGGSGPGGGTSPATVTNISTYVATEIAPVKYAWSSPDEWMIRFTPGSTTTSEVTSRGYTDGTMVMSNEVTRSVFQRNATASAVLVDESSVSDPVVTNWASSVGSTITSNGVVTADTDGSYRVTARAANGDIRYGNVILQSGTVTYSTNIYHAADVDGSGTKAANDDAVTKLLAATKVGDFIREGQCYAVYNAQKVYITSVGAGNVSPFAVSQHILGTAAHYPYRPLGAQTFTDSLGNTATVNKLRWVNLRDWARENGWSDAEIKDAGVDDIAFVICDPNIAIPDGCIPYFLAPTAAQRYADGKGVQAWQCSQFHEWAMPVTLTAWNSALVSGGDNAAIYTRADALARLGEMGKVNFCTSGDSGKPYFIVDGEGRTIVTFANTQRYRGANWVKGYAIIKAFVEAHGDTLKEVH